MADERKAPIEDANEANDAEAEASEPSGGSSRGRTPRQAVKGLALRAAGHATRMLSDQIKQPLGYVGDVAGELRRVSEKIELPYLDRLAGQLEQAATAATDIDVEDVVAKVQQFARRRPLAFLGATVGVGFLAARFLKSSAQSGGVQSAIGGEVTGAKPRRRSRRSANHAN